MARWALQRPPGRLQYVVLHKVLHAPDRSIRFAAMDRDEIASRIARAGRRRTRAMEAKRDASQELAELIPLARRAGIGVTEIVRLSGMSPRGVYDMIERRS
jgi:hypothetical protein